VSPTTIPLKNLIQETWVRNLGWDDPLPEDLVNQWEERSHAVSNLASITLPRATITGEGSWDLHVFGDASPKAYGAVAYATNYVTPPVLLLSKARVAPIKERSLPQLELTAMYIAAKLGKYVRETIKDCKIGQTYIWSDSEVALQWVKNGNSKIVYVQNRVQDIKTIDPDMILNYLSSQENPADLLTRGMKLGKFKESNLWFEGPEWLNRKSEWPFQKFDSSTSEVKVEVCQVVEVEPLIDPTRYNSWSKLVRVTRLVFKFLNKISNNKIHKSPQHYWIEFIQKQSCREVWDFLHGNRAASAPTMVKQLDLFILEGEGLIRCRGRISHAELPFHTKHPILLPSKHHVTRMIIGHSHKESLHAGVQETLCKARENFWIPRGRQRVKEELSKCFWCKRLQGAAYSYPKSPPLPKERVENALPFEIVGVDYTGAILIKNEATGEPLKVYIVLFTCATTRAVHLDLALDMTAETFLNIFRRFVARRSTPRVIISDNATNFKLGSNLLPEILNEEEVKQEFEGRNCEWKFIPPRAPWFGGFYERLVGVVKSCMRKALMNRVLNLDDLKTLIVEIEARVNNRPLTYASDDIRDQEPITPSHLLYGRRMNSLPAVSSSPELKDPTFKESIPLSKRYHKVSKLLKYWQDQWKNNYLTSLLERGISKGKSGERKETVRVGEVVLIHSERNRESWPMGVIEEVYRGKDGIIRTVRLRTKQGYVVRTINKLYPLEVNFMYDEDEVQTFVEQPDQTLMEASGNSTSKERNKSDLARLGTTNMSTPRVRLGTTNRSAPRAGVSKQTPQDNTGARPKRKTAEKARAMWQDLRDQGDL
jgi:hypothetical protein